MTSIYQGESLSEMTLEELNTIAFSNRGRWTSLEEGGRVSIWNVTHEYFPNAVFERRLCLF